MNKYSLICLCECWISNDDQIELPGYECLTFPRKKGKGGGIVIFYRTEIAKHIELVECHQDSVIWIKFTHNPNSKPVFIAFCYIPPENSVFYHRVECVKCCRCV